MFVPCCQRPVPPSPLPVRGPFQVCTVLAGRPSLVVLRGGERITSGRVYGVFRKGTSGANQTLGWMRSSTPSPVEKMIVSPYTVALFHVIIHQTTLCSVFELLCVSTTVPLIPCPAPCLCFLSDHALYRVQFSMVASVAYPDMYEVFLKHINVVNLNIGWMLSAGCVIDTDFYDKLLLSTLSPLVVVCGVATSHTVINSRLRSTDGREARARNDRRHASVLFWVSFLVYSTVSSTIFQTFACDEFDTGLSYLRADHSLECNTSTHTWFMVYAGIMGIIYPLGIPFCYAFVLFKGREVLKGEESRDTVSTDVGVLRELWMSYRPQAYLYEVVECARRAVLSGVIVFIFPNTAGQVATAFLLALFFAAVFMALDPYTSRWDTWAARTGHMVVLMSMFVALLQKVNIAEDDNFSQDVFAGVLVLANVAMILAAGAEVCGMCVTTVWEARQSVAVQSRAVAARSTQSIS